MSDQINLLFSGQLTGEFEQPQVMANLANILKLTPERAELLFTKATVIKRDASMADTKRFVQAFRKAGAVLEVVAAESSGPVKPTTDAASPDAASPDTTSLSSEGGELDLMPPGTPVLQEEERAEEPVFEGEVPSFDVAEAGEDINPNIEPWQARDFDFGDLAVEPLGEAPPPPTLDPK